MLNFNSLHARNEIAHCNHMMLRASGTFCIWFFYRNYADLDLLLSVTNEIAIQNNFRIETIKLSYGNAEEFQKFLVNEELEFIDTLIVSFCVEFNPHMLDEYIGQNTLAVIIDQKIELPEVRRVIDISKESGKRQYAAWLLDNISSQKIEYYDPDNF